MTSNDLPPLVRSLLRTSVYPHEVAAVRVVETHVSWVLLTGTFAYKLKKPVDLGFLDFSTLEKRRRAYEEELRLNRRNAPDLYLGLVAITGTPDRPVLHDDPPPPTAGAPIEYAVRMREFPQHDQLDRLLASGRLDHGALGSLLVDFAGRLASFHESAAVAGAEEPWGDAEIVGKPVFENFEQIDPLLQPGERAAVAELARWTAAAHERLERRFTERKQAGRVRECHGDLHLANLVLRDGRVRAFDCLEFDPALRWGDVAGEIAFLVLDLELHGLEPAAARFLGAYLEASGDYSAVAVLRYYLLYRAMVRCKIAAIRRAQVTDETDADEASASVRRHLGFGRRLIAPSPPTLVVLCGVSGSGKTWLGTRLAGRLAAVAVRSDVERKRLHGAGALADTHSGLGAGMYTPEASASTYERLAQCAEDILVGGFSAIVDATFLQRERRGAFIRLAGRLRVPVVIIVCDAPEELLRERIVARAEGGLDASEADPDVLTAQLSAREPVDSAEGAHVVHVDTAEPLTEDALDALARRVSGTAADVRDSPRSS